MGASRRNSRSEQAMIEGLIARIRGEFREMPDLRLTVAQASRLWQLDATTCQHVLDILMAENFVAQRGTDTSASVYSCV